MGQPMREVSFIESCENTLEEACISFEEADVATRILRQETAKLREQKQAAWATIHQLKDQIAEIRSRTKSCLPTKYEAKENASGYSDAQERSCSRDVHRR